MDDVMRYVRSSRVKWVLKKNFSVGIEKLLMEFLSRQTQPDRRDACPTKCAKIYNYSWRSWKYR